MSDDKKQPDNSTSTSSSSSEASANNVTGNEIPYVPPTDRTNLNEMRIDLETKPFIPPSSSKSSEE